MSLKVFNALQSVEKTIIRRQLSYYSLSSINLNGHNSYFKFILVLVGDINLSSRSIIMIDNNSMWDDLPFCNYNLSTEWTENQISFDSGNSNSVTSEVCLKIGKCILFER